MKGVVGNSDYFEKHPSLMPAEKIIQFGHGDLYQNLESLTIDADRKTEFLYGRIVFVSTGSLYSSAFIKKQYRSISKVLSARNQWPDILICASNPDIEVIFINKSLIRKDVLKDKINSVPPFSTAGKLLAFLYARFKYFNADADKGLTILSTSQDYDSPENIQSVVLELAHLNNVAPSFLDWIENANQFYVRHI